MGIEKHDKIDFADYLATERESDTRFEYYHSELFAMAGGTINHTIASGNVYGALRDAIRKGGGCIPFTSEMKVEIQPRGKYVYPNAGLACPKLIESKHLTGAISPIQP